jgi:hypothetical protein
VNIGREELVEDSRDLFDWIKQGARE